MANYYVINEFKNKAEIVINGYIGQWDDNNAKDFLSEFNRLAKSFKNIDIRILNSGGGEVFEGNAMISTIRQSDAVVDVYVDGLAASMAANIAISGSSLKMSKVAKIMFHKATGGVVGNSEDLRSAADLLEDIEKDILKMLAEKTGKEEKYFQDEFFSGTDKFLNAKEAEDLKISNATYDKAGKENNLQTEFKYVNNIMNNLNTNTMEKVENVQMFNAAIGLDTGSSEVDMFKAVLKVVELNKKLTKDVADKNAEITALTDGKSVLKDELKGYKEAAEASQKDKVDLLLTSAVEAGKITEDAKEDYRNIAENGENGFEYAKKVIEKIKPYQSISGKIKPDAKKVERKDGKTWNDYHKSGELANIKENDPEFYAELYKAKFGKELK